MTAQRSGCSIRALARRLGVDPKAIRNGIASGRLNRSIGYVYPKDLIEQQVRAWDDMERNFDRYAKDVRALLRALPQLLADRLHDAGARGGAAGIRRELETAIDEVLAGYDDGAHA